MSDTAPADHASAGGLDPATPSEAKTRCRRICTALPRIDVDGAAKSDADHLVRSPRYGKWFDMKRDWGMVAGAGNPAR
jgi:hypothetical protein